MSLMRRTAGSAWHPFRELDEMMERMSRAFPARVGQGDRENLAMADWTPSVDIRETDDDYVIDAELPRVRREDVKLSVEDGVLTLEGERKMHKEEGEKGSKYHRVETAYGSFMRRFSLPDDADEEKVAASFQDGTLEITIPKAKEQKPRARQISVK